MAVEASQIPVLNEYSQKRGLQLEWEDLNDVGLTAGFRVRVTVGQFSAEGIGRRKVQAKKDAASKLVSILRENGDLQSTASERSSISVLLELYQQDGNVHRPTDTLVGRFGPDHDRTFTVSYRVYDHSSHGWVNIEGEGKSKQSAKENAARNALSDLKSRGGLPQQSQVDFSSFAGVLSPGYPDTSASGSSTPKPGVYTGTLSNKGSTPTSSLPHPSASMLVSTRCTVNPSPSHPRPIAMISRGGQQPDYSNHDSSVTNLPELPPLPLFPSLTSAVGSKSKMPNTDPLGQSQTLPPIPKPRKNMLTAQPLNNAESEGSTRAVEQLENQTHCDHRQELATSSSMSEPVSMVPPPVVSSFAHGSSRLQPQPVPSCETDSRLSTGLIAPDSSFLPTGDDNSIQSLTAAVYNLANLSSDTMQCVSEPMPTPKYTVEPGESFSSILSRNSAIDPLAPNGPEDIRGLEYGGEFQFGCGRIEITFLDHQDTSNQFVCFATFTSSTPNGNTAVPISAIGAGDTRGNAKTAALENMWKT